VVVNECDKIAERAVADWQRATDVGMNMEKRTVRAVGCFARKLEPFDVGQGADSAVLHLDAIDRQSSGGALQPFNVYVAN
jgi:hypothetical protein